MEGSKECKSIMGVLRYKELERTNRKERVLE
jgi:hypothetical protein